MIFLLERPDFAVLAREKTLSPLVNGLEDLLPPPLESIWTDPLRARPKITQSLYLGSNGVIPFGMKGGRGDVQGFHLAGSGLSACGVGEWIKVGFDFESF